MPIEVIWEDPPEPGPTGALKNIAAVLEQLKAHPQKWARVGEWTAESGAYSAKRRLTEEPRPAWVPAGRFEYKIVREERDETGKNGRPLLSSKLYARYLNNK